MGNLEVYLEQHFISS